MTYLQLKQNKYRNIPQEYNGYKYQSKKEAEYAQLLDLQLRAQGKDRVIDWNQQVKISFDVLQDGRLIARSTNAYLPKSPPNLSVAKHLCSYIVDFLVVYPGGLVELIEIKSHITMTDVWKLKRNLLEATVLREHPDTIRYLVLK